MRAAEFTRAVFGVVLQKQSVQQKKTESQHDAVSHQSAGQFQQLYGDVVSLQTALSGNPEFVIQYVKHAHDNA